MPLTRDQLAANAEVAEHLGWHFDLELAFDPDEPAWFSVDGAERFRRIGRDGAGGWFAQLSDSGRVLYASSEGAAGILAADLDAFVQLLVACPYWHDVLKYSRNGNLDEMRRAAAALEADARDDDELSDARSLLKTQLGLDEPADPIGALHHAISAADVVIRAPDGDPCVSLFGRFTIDDNPMLRTAAD